MGNVNAKDPDYWNVPDDPGIRNTNWMSKLPDSRLISDLSIPGTHDTMARAGNLIWSWCQSLSLGVQLGIGLRFLDIRCRHYNNGLPIHHGAVYENSNFTGVAQEMEAFLRSNPSEVILMRVKEEYKAEGNTRPFWKTVQVAMDQFPNLFWKHQYVPTIGEVRGKVVMLVNFNSDEVLGIPYGSLRIEDHYEENAGDTKWNYVKGNLENARSESGSTMYLTFNSASGDPPGIQAPREIARSMNTRLHDFVKSFGGRQRLGIIAIDYPGPVLVQNIIDRSF